MGRPPVDKKKRQVPVALPPDLRDLLDAEAAAAGHSLAEEIRNRLVLTIELDRFDKPSRDLAEALMWIGDEIRRQTRQDWHSNRKANEALAAALQDMLEALKPKLTRGVGASDLFGPDDPATLGRSIARHYRRFKAELAKSNEEMRKLQEGEKP